MIPALRKRLIQVGSFVVGGVLLYLALRNVDFARVGADLRQADYRWLFPLAFVTLFSHWLRAWRWTLFLDELPQTKTRVTKSDAFGALMIGYMTNYVAPRIGEVVRTVNLATRNKLRVSAVFGTVAVERVLDVVVMGCAFLTIPFLFVDRFDVLGDLLFTPIFGWLASVPRVLVIGGAAVSLAVFLWIVQKIRKPSGRLASALASFRDGFLALGRTPRRGVLIGTTIGMWFCYALMAHIPFLMFGIEGISLLDSWGIMLLGAIGVVIPSPGGFGSYHYITIQTLVLLYGFETATAASYALLTHTGQLMLYVIVGFIVILQQGTGLGNLLAAPPDDA